MQKVIVIIGTSSRTGKYPPITLAQQGCTVHGLAERTEKIKELKEVGGHALNLIPPTIPDSRIRLPTLFVVAQT